MKKILLPFVLLCCSVANSQPKIVGMLTYGGPLEGGSIFRCNLPASTPGIIHQFNNLTPHRPGTGLEAGDLDWLYGTLVFNGTNNQGCIYRIRQDGTGFEIINELSNFAGSIVTPYYHSDGLVYYSNEFQIRKFDPATDAVTEFNLSGSIYVRMMLIDDDDWIYFTTGTGIAKIKTDGTQWTDMHTFLPATEGAGGVAGLTEVPGDSLIGAQNYGGLNDAGTLYSIKKDGNDFTVLHQFTSATGIFPESKIFYFDGKLYGTTSQGGDFNNGVIYTINPDGSNYRVVHHFASSGSGQPLNNIHVTSNGRIFGSYWQYFSTGSGIFRMYKLDTSGADFEPFSTINQREYGTLNLNFLMLNDESVYLTTQEGGRHDGGGISFTDTLGNSEGLHLFGLSPNGFRPNSLIKGSDGKLYGVTAIGGPDGNGIIYNMNADGTGYTKLHELLDAEGYEPFGKLLEASDGKLYGACRWGNPSGTGSIYRLNKNGTNFEVIWTQQTNFTDGYSPVGSLVEGSNGKLYGANFLSAPGNGTLFSINKDGSGYTVLKQFDVATGICNPLAGVYISGNTLYGTCYVGGAESKGGIFKINTDGSNYTVLHEFSGPTDGANPYSNPILASNGKIYGTTPSGGSNQHGIVYSIDITGLNYTILRHLDGNTDGAYPYAPPIQGSDGLIYGANFSGNMAGGSGGTIFRMNLDGSNFTMLKSFDPSAEGGGIWNILDLEGQVALPVQWLTFTGTKKNNAVQLDWKTAQEQNSDLFEIERSADGNQFSKIGAVAAAGTTNTISSYSFLDRNPFTGSNYYRLKQVDIDKSFSYSRIVHVNFTKTGIVSIFPNPASHELNIKLFAGHGYRSVNIFDASGRNMMQQTISSSSTTEIKLDVRKLPAGWYAIKLNGDEETNASFIKN